MAVVGDLCLSIRERVLDDDVDNQKYAGDTYERALNRGLRRVNIDLNTTYTIGTLPSKHEYLVELRGTIEMCRIRGAEGAQGGTNSSSPVQSISVPQLSASFQAGEGPSYWAKLCEDLEEEYEDVLDTLEGDDGLSGNVTVGVMTRISRRTGRRTPLVYDNPLEAPTMALSLDGSVVVVSWSRTISEDFLRYEVERDTAAAFGDPEQVALQPNPHTVEYRDEPGVGTWYYRVVAVNSNRLRSNSVPSSATVV